MNVNPDKLKKFVREMITQLGCPPKSMAGKFERAAHRGPFSGSCQYIGSPDMQLQNDRCRICWILAVGIEKD